MVKIVTAGVFLEIPVFCWSLPIDLYHLRVIFLLAWVPGIWELLPNIAVSDGTIVVNTVPVAVLVFRLERNVLVSECSGVPFRCRTVHI